MNDSAITLGTRILRPEVITAHYAIDQDGYWRVEGYRDGHADRQKLPRPPTGVTCHRSIDDFATWQTFTVPGRPPTAQILCLLLAILAIPAAFLALPGSVPIVRAAVGIAVIALMLWQAWVEQLAVRDPAAARRLVWLTITELALTHHRHAHHR